MKNRDKGIGIKSQLGNCMANKPAESPTKLKVFKEPISITNPTVVKIC
jgi:hypothetical protein